MTSQVNDNDKKIVYRNFDNTQGTNSQHIVEFTGSKNGSPYPEGNNNHIGILFSVQNDQQFDSANHIGSMMIIPTVHADGYISSSQLKFFLKHEAGGASELSEAFTIQPGSLQSESLTLDKSDGDVVFNLKVNNTNIWTVGIDSSNAMLLKYIQVMDF